MTIITVGLLGITAVLMASALKDMGGEFGTYLAVAAGCLIFFLGVEKLGTIVETMQRIEELIRISPVYLKMLLKMAGITYVAGFSSGMCRDAGYGGIGNQIEIFGKLSILAVSMPVVLSLLETLQDFLTP
ncbi:MAG: stage III sporulation AC/AD family protein [Clostridiales bacterium]|nr:stage III sporulation AC/AD family protein [Clostridiales bacterium]